MAAVKKVTIPFSDAPSFFVRVTGKDGKQRELRALVSTACQCVVISRVDALQLGYNFVYERDNAVLQLMGGEMMVGNTLIGLIEVVKFKLDEIRIGDLSVKDVEAVAYDIPMAAGIDVLLGHNFLSRLKAVIDYEKGQITFEEVTSAEESSSG